MIQVFKGVTLNEAKNKKGLIYDESPSPSKRSDHLREIKGWENELHEIGQEEMHEFHPN